jgi:hypothetical protein
MSRFSGLLSPAITVGLAAAGLAVATARTSCWARPRRASTDP